MSTEITKAQNFSVATLDTFNFEEMREELEGLGSVSLDVVKNPSGGGLTFELPSDDPENPEISKEIVGVIVHHHALNAYWANKYDGDKNPPDCVSVDAKTGIVLRTGECRNCANCPFNKFGSNGEAKACKNLHRLYILREGDVMPLELNVPPSSLKNFKDYITKRIILRGTKLSNVVTKISLKKAQSAGGITYSQHVYSKVGDLSTEQIEKIRPLTELCKVIGSQMPTPQINNGAEDPVSVMDSVINQADNDIPMYEEAEQLD